MQNHFTDRDLRFRDCDRRRGNTELLQKLCHIHGSAFDEAVRCGGLFVIRPELTHYYSPMQWTPILIANTLQDVSNSGSFSGVEADCARLKSDYQIEILLHVAGFG